MTFWAGNLWIERTIQLAAEGAACRMMVLSAINTGLSAVYEQLLGFQGQEFYEAEWESLQGKQYLQPHGALGSVSCVSCC
jgi:hypothetical protein